MQRHGRVLIAPNGSLVTPISKRVSASSLLLAKRFDAKIVPWKFRYYNCKISEKFNYNPIGLILSRLFSDVSTVYCKRGASDDLDIDKNSISREIYSDTIKAYYS